MIRTTMRVSGMACGMCEVHVNDAVRSAFPVKKVSSSRARRETVIESEAPLDHEKLRQVISNTGYLIARQTYERHKTLMNFLVRLGVDKETARKDACMMEHDLSDESFEAIARVIPMET